MENLWFLTLMLKPEALLVCFVELCVKPSILQNVAKRYFYWHHAELENDLTGCQGRLAEVVHWLTAAEPHPSASLSLAQRWPA